MTVRSISHPLPGHVSAQNTDTRYIGKVNFHLTPAKSRSEKLRQNVNRAAPGLIFATNLKLPEIRLSGFEG
jgi:hypothetical protein